MVLNISNERKRNGLKVFNAGLGANPFPAHKSLLDVFEKNISKKNYLSPSGLKELSDQIKDTYSSDNYIVTNTIVGN